jgi:hypothetical protein
MQKHFSCSSYNSGPDILNLKHRRPEAAHLPGKSADKSGRNGAQMILSSVPAAPSLGKSLILYVHTE